MPVVSLSSYILYNTDGFTSHFTFPYYVDQSNDLLVESFTFPSTITNYQLGTDYTVSGAQDSSGSYPNGIVVNFLMAPATGMGLVLSRQTRKTQLTEYIDNNPFTAESLNHALDKLTLLVQDYTAQFKGSALGPPTSNVDTYSVGDWFKNILTFNDGDPFGWICVADGTPGSWKAFGELFPV